MGHPEGHMACKKSQQFPNLLADCWRCRYSDEGKLNSYAKKQSQHGLTLEKHSMTGIHRVQPTPTHFIGPWPWAVTVWIQTLIHTRVS